MKTLKIRAYDINWDVQEEDIDINEFFDKDAQALDEKAFDLAVEDAIQDALDELPTEVIIELEVSDDYDEEEGDEFLEDTICDELSEEYGWLVESYNYEIIK